ncbi:hypothetical protein SNE40_004161 [Patella caerulea]|uniref:Uncharacterized protein n=1 Tax=Patella caerulea TaxID=87958 RepID=A0AAN8Q1K6_PATCE
MADEVVNENINLSDGSDSDEDSPPRIKKQKSSTVRRGLAGLINKSKQNTENEPEEDCPSKYAIYSTKVARCLSDRQNNYNLLKVSLAEEDKEEEQRTKG